MTRSRHAFALAIGLLALFFVGSAQAQEDLSAGKTPEELFKLDCSMCHRTPQGLSKAGGIFGLDNFLAQHYTASPRSAAVIAAYLKSVDSAARQAAPHRRSRSHRAAEPRKSAGKSAGKSDTAKPEGKSEAKTEPKRSEPKKTDKPKTDTADEKPPKADEPKADQPKMADPKPAERKPAATGTKSEAKREKPKSEMKPEKKTD